MFQIKKNSITDVGKSPTMFIIRVT